MRRVAARTADARLAAAVDFFAVFRFATVDFFAVLRFATVDFFAVLRFATVDFFAVLRFATVDFFAVLRFATVDFFAVLRFATVDFAVLRFAARDCRYALAMKGFCQQPRGPNPAVKQPGRRDPGLQGRGQDPESCDLGHGLGTTIVTRWTSASAVQRQG
jgi:hypothetical protein